MAKTTSLEILKESLLKRKEDGETWAGMAREYDVNPAVLWRIAHEGYNPKKEKTRRKLGLPEVIQREAYRNEKGRFQKRDQR
jgi:hypothetical protein